MELPPSESDLESQSALLPPVETDPFSGFPYPLVPLNDINGRTREETNRHHNVFPSTHPILVRTPGGKALRSMYIQVADVNFHRTLHGAWGGPPIPEDEGEQLGMVLLGAALYLPERVVDLRNGDEPLRAPTNNEFARLREPGVVSTPPLKEVARYRRRKLPDEPLPIARQSFVKSLRRQADYSSRHLHMGSDQVQSFLGGVVSRQDPTQIPGITSLAEQYCATEGMDGGARRALLMEVAHLVVDTAETRHGTTVAEHYAEAGKQGRLHPRMARDAADFVVDKLGTGHLANKLALTIARAVLADGLDESEPSVA